MHARKAGSKSSCARYGGIKQQDGLPVEKGRWQRQSHWQELVNTVWAFATVDQANAPLLAALARAANHRVYEFNLQELVNTAWAFATADQANAPLFAALA